MTVNTVEVVNYGLGTHQSGLAVPQLVNFGKVRLNYQVMINQSIYMFSSFFLE